MIETEANLPRKKMKMFSRHSAERIQPVFGIAPEAFDPVDVISTLRGPAIPRHEHDKLPPGDRALDRRTLASARKRCRYTGTPRKKSSSKRRLVPSVITFFKMNTIIRDLGSRKVNAKAAVPRSSDA